MKQSVVLYPSAGTGHVVPMAELAKVFINHGFDVTMVVVPEFSSQFKRVAAANPSTSFHVLPPVSPPPADVAGSGMHPLLSMLKTLRWYNEELERFLCSVTSRQHLHSLVIDMFCVDAIGVAARLGVPAYTFAPSSASALAVLTQVPTLLASSQRGLKELGDTPLEFLGVPPVPASHLNAELLERPEEELCSTVASVFRRGMDTRGVLVNTFQALETRALQALGDPRCVPGKAALPPIYCVGPLVGNSAQDPPARAGERHDECLRWLDAQPERSVVFLCFGSMGAFSQEQLKEIATGLDKSGHRFLWVVRRPASSIFDPKRFLGRQPKLDLDAVLPEGFLERTRGRGLVVRSWAPQGEVLQHPATSSFVTHCGWNSVLEGVMAGVPMLCWPLYAEQRMNKVFMTGDMGVAVEMEGYQTGFVKAEAIEAKIRLVMESEEGRELRVRVAARTKEATAAMEAGGSSRVAFAQFLADVRSTRHNVCKL
jgi:hypothetical protein